VARILKIVLTLLSENINHAVLRLLVGAADLNVIPWKRTMESGDEVGSYMW